MAIRRRRECTGCQRRFTTYERIETAPLLIVKKDGRREPFDRQKILKGILTACEKRPVPLGQIEDLAASVERKLRQGDESEVESGTIGEMVMEALRAVDEVAYIRFASVYRQFADASSFREEIERLGGPARSPEESGR